ncbi:MAG: type 1 glutamine amidotransferase [Actinomycetia bacterium]|nr:type 1 glutamine amidotransferase [Actinomycetes bacterium]
MRVATIRHAPFEGAGAIAAWAVDRGHGFATTMAATGAFPAPADYDLLVVMGGPMSANDEARFAWLAAEKTAVRAGIDAGKRVLGVCLGAQIVASVLGAAVTRNPEPEIGWFPVTLTSAGRTSRVFGSLPNSLVAGHWHSDIFALPEGAVRIAGSEACANQAFEYDEGRVVGVQFHLEWTAQGAQALVEHCSADLVPGMHVVTAEGFIAGEAEHGVSARTALYALLDAMTGVRE